MARIVSTGKTLSSPEYHQKKKEERKRKVILWSLGVMIFLVVFVVVARLEKFLVNEIRVSGAQVIAAEEISQNVLETLKGKYLWLIPKANAALLPRGEVRKNLNQKFPRFSSIDLSLEGSRALRVSVVERKPFALYCPSAERPEDASACFFLDQSGFIFDEAPAFSGVVYFVYSLQMSLENPKGTQFLESKKFENLASFVEALPKLGFEPLAVEVGERETSLTLPDKAKIIWNTEDDLALLFSNLESFLNTEEIKKDPQFLEKMKTLDLKTENKVFYRFKE